MGSNLALVFRMGCLVKKIRKERNFQTLIFVVLGNFCQRLGCFNLLIENDRFCLFAGKMEKKKGKK